MKTSGLSETQGELTNHLNNEELLLLLLLKIEDFLQDDAAIAGAGLYYSAHCNFGTNLAPNWKIGIDELIYILIISIFMVPTLILPTDWICLIPYSLAIPTILCWTP